MPLGGKTRSIGAMGFNSAAWQAAQRVSDTPKIVQPNQFTDDMPR